jgi:UDP-N-acetylglucosamine transferase subunit ALG13
MIFVTVGNALQPFDRLVKAIDLAVATGALPREVFIQRGHGAYEPREVESKAFLDGGEFEARIRAADVVVSHAGVGTVLQSLRGQKIPVLVPRRREFNEVVDDHQLQICEVLEKEGKAVYVRDLQQLPGDIARAVELTRQLVLEPRSDTPRRLHREVRAYLQVLADRREAVLDPVDLTGGA